MTGCLANPLNILNIKCRVMANANKYLSDHPVRFMCNYCRFVRNGATTNNKQAKTTQEQNFGELKLIIYLKFPYAADRVSTYSYSLVFL